MERLRSLKISVEVDTNKTTRTETFEDVEDMLVWLESLNLGLDYIVRENDVQDSPSAEEAQDEAWQDEQKTQRSLIADMHN